VQGQRSIPTVTEVTQENSTLNLFRELVNAGYPFNNSDNNCVVNVLCNTISEQRSLEAFVLFSAEVYVASFQRLSHTQSLTILYNFTL
jgi:hypothetical protein